MFDSKVNKIYLGTDGAASSRVGQILPLREERSIPYSASLIRICDLPTVMYKSRLKFAG